MCSLAEASSPRGALMLDQDSPHSIPAIPAHSSSLVASHVSAHPHARSKHLHPTTSLPPQTDIVVVGNGPAGILISLLLNGYEPYYHAKPSRPHPDPILHSMLAPTALEGCRPKSMLKQDFAQLTNHIQHQLAEAGRDANPISAMFDSLAHPHLDTHRGEYPSFLHWKHPPTRDSMSKQLLNTPEAHSQSPPSTSTFERSTAQHNVSMTTTTTTTTTARPHLVLGRGAVGGIWADMEQDHNQTLSYNEHMELPLYSFAKFLSEHSEYADQQELDRPLRSAVSAYYKTYVQRMEIQSNFSDFTTVTSVYHLKDLPGHCCCSLDPKLDSKHRRQAEEEIQERMRLGLGPCKECSPFRYAVLGHVDAAPSPSISDQASKTAPLTSTTSTTTTSAKRRSKFLVRCKTVVLATGTFDQPKKLQAVSLHPCLPLPSADPATLTIKQTFHDTRQLEEWMKRHGPNDTHISASTAMALAGSNAVSPPSSPSPSRPADLESLNGAPVVPEGDAALSNASLQAPTPPHSPQLPPPRPIVIVGTGLSAADAILLIQEKQPWRRVIHIYKHFTASEPSPLKRCHRDVYPGYASIWLRMRKCATLKNSVQMYQRPKIVETGTATKGQENQQQKTPCCQIFGDVATHCEQCQLLQQEQKLQDHVGSTETVENAPLALCSACSYRGLPDASISSWDPIAGEVVILLSHGVVIKEKVAAVGVFIGKEVHMGFLKGSLAEEMLSSPLEDPEFSGSSSSSTGAGYLSPPLFQSIAGNPFDAKADLRRRLGSASTGRRGRRPRRGSADSSRELAANMLTPPCTPPRSPILRPRKQSFWSKPCQLLQGALENKMMDPEAHAPPSSQGEGLKAGGDENEICCSNNGDGEGTEEETEESSEESEEEKVEEHQVLTLLRPLVSDMYNFRIIPSTTTSSSSPSLSGSLVATDGLLDRQLASVSSASAPLSSVVAYPTKAKKCARLPCYPIRNSDCSTTSTTATKALDPTSGECSRSTLAVGDTTVGGTEDEPCVGDASESVSTSNDPVPRVGANLRATSSKTISKSACLSMPCSPLLRSCRTVCPTLATPPLLTLCSTAAANALTNCLQSLTKTCRTSTPNIKDSDKDIKQDEEVGSEVLLSASASSISSLSRSGSVRSNRSTSISSCASSVCTLPLDEPSPLVGKEEGFEEVSMAPSSPSAAATVDTEHNELVQLEGEAETKEDRHRHHHRPRPLVAPSCTPSLYPRVDQSIYAAGAITGSKFVRYVLGNGVAIVADILRHEELEASL